MSEAYTKSALGTDGNVAALLGYLFWIVAVILVFIEKENKFVRFHALQSTFWGLLIIIGGIVGYVLFFVLFFAGTIVGAIIDAAIGFPIVTFIVMIVAIIALLIGVAALLGGFVGNIIAAIKSYGGNTFKMPIVGKFAEKYTNK